MQRLIYIVCIFILSCQIKAAIILGNPNGKVTLDFVYDYQCNYCHKMWQEIKKFDDAKSDVKIRLFPIYAINNTSLIQAASLIYLALETDRFYEINDYLLSNKPIDADQFKNLLSRYIKLDDIFMREIRNSRIKTEIDEGITILSKNNTEKVPFVIITSKEGRSTTLQGYQEHKAILKEIHNAS